MHVLTQRLAGCVVRDVSSISSLVFLFISDMSITVSADYLHLCSTAWLHIDLEGSALGLASHSLSDRRWGVIIGQPMRHLLSQMFQQQINSAT